MWHFKMLNSSAQFCKVVLATYTVATNFVVDKYPCDKRPVAATTQHAKPQEFGRKYEQKCLNGNGVS